MPQRRTAFAGTRFEPENDLDGGQEDCNRRTYYTLGIYNYFAKYLLRLIMSYIALFFSKIFKSRGLQGLLALRALDLSVFYPCSLNVI